MSNKLKNSKYCILPFDTTKNIIELRLNKCPTRQHNNTYLHKPKKQIYRELDTNKSNQKKNNSNNIRIATINVRSIKNKQQQIIETSKIENTDIIHTKTWLKNLDEDKAWIDTSDLHSNNLRIDMVHRTARQGGGKALLHRKEYITTRLETNLQLNTVEHGVWSTTIGNKKLTLVGIYHPPIGS